MTPIEFNRIPSSRERKALGLALCALGGVVALMIWLRPESLVVITWVTGLAWCASILLNKDEPLSRQWKGIIIPLIVGLLHSWVLHSESPATIAVAVAVALAVLGIVVLFRARFGNKFYETWSVMFLPLAWCISTLLLVLVYYGVLTPIGLFLRMIGHDPLQRKFDREAESYWVRRHEAEHLERFFRQF